VVGQLSVRFASVCTLQHCSQRPRTRALTTAMRTAQPIAQLAPLSKVEMAILPARTCELASPTDLATIPIPRNRPPHLPKMTSPALL
jgi:hypothetical protein